MFLGSNDIITVVHVHFPKILQRWKLISVGSLYELYTISSIRSTGYKKLWILT